jgi:hypothetical protein
MLHNNMALHWHVRNVVFGWFARITEHHQLHLPEPVGMFAGSLLPRNLWDH